tara:strand:+ start:768 stop:1292 length:525 start_codon:yes stop_codon:yes gene_type:complete
MAGSLIKIQETTVSSSTASVTLAGIDSTYDVYMVRYNNVTIDTDTIQLRWRYRNSSGDVTSANYDFARKILRSNASFSNSTGTGAGGFTAFRTVSVGTGTGEQANGLLYLFNFNNSSEYSFHTEEGTSFDYQPSLAGIQGGGVLTVAEAHTGLTFFPASGNFDSGTFTLYGLKK